MNETPAQQKTRELLWSFRIDACNPMIHFASILYPYTHPYPTNFNPNPEPNPNPNPNPNNP